jgi:predicted N-acetyltransferase YhbS
MTDLAITVSPERDVDAAAIAAIEERAFGPGRFARSAYRLREGRGHDIGLSFVARVSSLVIGSVRQTRVLVGATPVLLLGPLTVEPAFRSRGVGRLLLEKALAAAAEAGQSAVLLVGDEAYYARVGFRRLPPGRVTMPGPVDPARLLVRELAEGAAAGLAGKVTPAA